MDTELKILVQHGFLSRKQYRELLGERPASVEQLKALIVDRGYLDPPDWKEAEGVLASGDVPAEDSAPDSLNPRMQELYQTAMRVAATDTNVLVLGESGVGKTRLARLIHENSTRRSGPLVTVACGSIPDTLLESELFGVEKGAYTGAVRSREGRFQRAHGGTIFLDEIGELSASLQVKLLRVVQERKIEPLGSAQEIDVDVRLVTATNRNLEDDIEAGRFREDLYFRLNVVPFTMLPLRERTEDIVPLAEYFLRKFSEKDGVRYSLDNQEVRAVLQRYDWPGNIRELENCLERLAVLSSEGVLRVTDFPQRVLMEAGYRPGIRPEQPAPPRSSPAPQVTTIDSPQARDGAFLTLREMEHQHIVEALELANGNVYRAAGLLKIHRNTLARKLEEMSVDPSDYKKRRRRKAPGTEVAARMKAE